MTREGRSPKQPQGRSPVDGKASRPSEASDWAARGEEGRWDRVRGLEGPRVGPTPGTYSGTYYEVPFFRVERAFLGFGGTSSVVSRPHMRAGAAAARACAHACGPLLRSRSHWLAYPPADHPRFGALPCPGGKPVVDARPGASWAELGVKSARWWLTGPMTTPWESERDSVEPVSRLEAAAWVLALLVAVAAPAGLVLALAAWSR